MAVQKMAIERIAISGASGLIGSTLIQELTSDRFSHPEVTSAHSLLRPPLELFLLKRPNDSTSIREENPSSKTAGTTVQPQTIDWEPSRGVINPAQLEGMDVIIHLAGRPIDSARWSPAEKSRLRDSRVLATQRLVEQISHLDLKPKVFLSASAVGIYGDCGADRVSESHHASQDFLGQLALDWEAASRPLEALGIRLIHARFGVVLTKRGGALKKIVPLFRAGFGGRLGSGRQYMSWIGLVDCVRALTFLLQNEQATGPFNLTSPNPVTNQEFTQAIGQAVHRPTLLPAPSWGLRLVLGEMADALLLSSCRATPNKLQELGFEFQYPELQQCIQCELQ